jgi:hypothetical protein
MTVRRMSANGMVSFKGTPLYVGELLAEQPVGLR